MSKSEEVKTVSKEEAHEAVQGLTRSDLLAIIEAIRTPHKTPEQLRDEKQKQEDRLALRESLLQAEEERRLMRENCSHMRKDGSTRSVYISSMNFLLCQECGLVVRPEERPDLFNRLYQLAVQ